MWIPRAEPHSEAQGDLRVFRRMTRDPARNDNMDALGTVRGGERGGISIEG